jgi:hypothetical protein
MSELRGCTHAAIDPVLRWTLQGSSNQFFLLLKFPFVAVAAVNGI